MHTPIGHFYPMTKTSGLPFRVLAVTLLAVAGCGDDPVQVEDQVIEEITFDPSLNIDLASMTRDPATGVYTQDLVDGTGDPVDYDSQVSVSYSGWLSDGTLFDSGTDFAFVVGGTEFPSPILGFHVGVLGMRLGGERLMLLPPEVAYGPNPPPGSGIPPGSVLVFRVILDEHTP